MNTATLAHPRAPTRPARNAGHGHWSRGCELVARADWDGAAQAFARAARAAPDDLLYWVNLANAERRGGALTRAETAARRALAIDAGDPLALRVLGDCLSQMHRYADAVEVLAQLKGSGTLEPEALVQQAKMLMQLMRQREAVDLLIEALAARPDLVLAHALLAEAFRDLGRKRESVECMRTVLALQPGNLEAMSRLSFEKRHLCDWRELDDDVRQMSELLATAPPGLARDAAVFGMLSLPITPQLHLAAARAECQALVRQAEPLPTISAEERSARASRPARIGWVSYDFRQHPVSQLLVEMLEGLDRSRFEVLLYSSGPDDGSPLRRRMEAAADRFVDLRGLSDAQGAQRVRDDGVDVLIDLTGHTRGRRLGLLAARPAPLQVAYLGFPSSTGADFIDYLIGDPLVTPLELAADYSEKLAQLPLCFQPNGRWRPLPQPMSRAAAGLPEDAFVMCAFNHTYKILPQAFDAWCAVMREVPHAVLWLKQTNDQLHANVLREAAARGIEPQRIVFAPMVSYEDHFSRVALADVFVDTWPYNAHTTAADALWAGVPVVTVYGNSFASRVAASVLSAAGLGELAFGSAEEYRCAIVALALDPELLAGYRRHLSEQRMALPLFDSARYTREFETVLSRMLERWHAGQAPDHLPA